jgi:hypothetical protein
LLPVLPIFTNYLGYGPASLNDIFSQSISINGLVAILSGLLANVLVDNFGFIGPFIASPLFNMLAFVYIMLVWKENYGTDNISTADSTSLMEILTGIIILLIADKSVLSVGMMQVCLESTMYQIITFFRYNFVFLWSPTMENVAKDNLPFGIMFSTFMTFVMIGSLIFKSLRAIKIANETILCVSFFIATICFLTLSFTKV